MKLPSILSASISTSGDREGIRTENAKTQKGESANRTEIRRDLAGSNSPESVGFRVFALSRFRVLFGPVRP